MLYENINKTKTKTKTKNLFEFFQRKFLMMTF